MGVSRNRKFWWATLPEEELLKLRLKDLNVTVEGTWLEDCLEKLHNELAERDLRIRPHAWISSEWFSPEGTPRIAILYPLAADPVNAAFDPGRQRRRPRGSIAQGVGPSPRD
jgi:hypothetical protein